MSMFDLILGKSPGASELLDYLGIEESQTGRFRDCYLTTVNCDGDLVDNGNPVICVYTRNGAGNRDEYQPYMDALKKHPLYLKDEDDTWDCTYASIYFKIPEGIKETVNQLLVEVPQLRDCSGQKRFQHALEALEGKR